MQPPNYAFPRPPPGAQLPPPPGFQMPMQMPPPPGYGMMAFPNATPNVPMAIPPPLPMHGHVVPPQAPRFIPTMINPVQTAMPLPPRPPIGVIVGELKIKYPIVSILYFAN